MQKRVDTIYERAKDSLDEVKAVLVQPEVKRKIKWTAVIGMALGLILFIFSSGILFYPQKTQAAADWQATGTKQSGTGALTVAWPTHQIDDVALLFVESENQTISLSTPNGFAEVANSPIGTGTAGGAGATRLAVYWARATSSSMASPVVADSGDHTFAVIVTFRGVITTGDPVDATANAVTTPANTTTTFPAVSASAVDDVVVLASAVDLDANSTAVYSGFTNSNLSNLNERFDQVVNTGDGGGLGIATGTFSGSGSTGTTNGTHTSSITTQMTIALKSAPPTITVGTTGTQTTAMLIPSTNQYVGGAFTFQRDTGTANVTAITISETDASLVANTYLTNVKLYYKQEASCSISIPGDATAYNATGVGFNASEKVAITGDSAMVVGTFQICVYVQLNVGSGAPNGDYFDIEITNPSTEVTVSAGLVAPASAVAISGSTQINLAPAVKQDHYRWRNDNGPQGNQAQTLYFNPTGNGYGTAEFGIVGGCTAGSEWDCVDDDTVDTSSSQPTSDLETSQLLLAAATDYYTLADDVLLAGSTVSQLDITVSGADDVGNPNTSVTLGYCIICDGANDVMGSAQNITGADQTKTQQFTGLSLSTTDLNNMQLVITASGNKAEISTLYVLVTYSVPEATWAQLEDTPHTGLEKSTNIRLRFQVDNTGGSATNYNYRLEYAARGADSLCDTSYSQETYYAVPDSPTTEHFDMTLSNAPGYVDGEPTTAKLSNGESLTFVAGNTVESTSNQTGNITLAQNEYTEAEYVFQANTNATDGGVYCLRVTNAGTVLNSADAVAQVTLSGGGNSAPNNPSSLAQKKTDDTVISTGGWINQTSVKFTATASDTDNPDTLQLCVEKDLLGTGFSNTEDACGTGVAYSGTPVTVTVTISGIIDSSEYHWQARIKDAASAYSGWVSYDINLESARDFGIDTTAPTGGTVKDGTGADQDWNNGSLSVIDGNWTGTTPDSSSSGLLKYEYAIRRQSDSWYWNNSTWQSGEFWTDNGAATSFTKSSMNLQTGATYYISLKTTDNAGNVATINSNGQQVSPTLSFSFDSNLVTFSDLNNSNNWTDTKTTTLTVSTNASAGYTIKASINQLLTSIAYPAQTIANFIGTWATPQNWLNFCKDDSNDCGFGYTSNDTLVQSSNRFSGGTLFAAYSGTSPGDVVADHTDPVNGSTGAVSNEQFTITHKVSVPSSQAASTYQTTAIFVITANY